MYTKTWDRKRSIVDNLSFFLLLDEDDLKYLNFSDSLVTVSDTGKELGEFVVNVDLTTHQGKDCFLVHANSHGAIDNVPCGTSITAYVTRNLETLEQQHHEYVKVGWQFWISSSIWIIHMLRVKECIFLKP